MHFEGLAVSVLRNLMTILDVLEETAQESQFTQPQHLWPPSSALVVPFCFALYV